MAVVYDRDHALHVLNAGATDDELTLRTQTLASSAWAFFRGTSPLYYRDLGELPKSAYATAAGDVWLTGDAHLENTGADRGADNEEQLALDDTDDAWRGSWTWELRREAVSIVLAGRANGRSASQIATDVDTFVAEYAQWIAKFHGTGDEASWRLTSRNSSDLVGDLIDAAAGDKRADLVAKWTTGGHFKADPELQTVSPATRGHRQPRPVPLVRPRRGRHDVVVGRPDPRAQAGGRPGAEAARAGRHDAHRRPALALRWLANQSDPLAGWASVGSTPVLVKEKSPFAEDLEIGDLTSSAVWDDTVRDVGRLLAAAHSRADQVATDWHAYVAAKNSGRPLF